VENIETQQFLKDATEHLMHLTNSKVDTIACDLHPKFTTTNLAFELSKRNGWQLIQVQHHHAHIAALMAEHGEKKMLGIACDGYGYGEDGSAWGGEILLCEDGAKEFKRLGHLEPQPLPGGDIATKYPLRIAAGILNKRLDVEPWLLKNSIDLSHGETEARILLQLLENSHSIPQTTSLGRILDAASAILGVCRKRTYEGEAAMKLESAALNGKDVLQLAPIIRNDQLETSTLLSLVFENTKNFSKNDLAYSIHSYLANGLATLAVEKAVDLNVGTVGFTGGAAVNVLLASMMRKIVENAGLHFSVHEAIPAGDGGVSLGQAVVGGF
jgi:hydrogenase maturation protein HypF